MSAEEQLSLVLEAHAKHRNELALLKSRVTSVERALGDISAYQGSFQVKSLAVRVRELEAQQRAGSDADVVAGQLRKLADAFAEIFADDSGGD
jgi:septation ring formation regulator EzrA